MDVTKINQGGQIGFDSASIRNDNIKAPLVISTAKTSNDSSTTTYDSDNKDKVNETVVKKAMDKLADFISNDNVKVEYEFHKVFHDIIIKITDKNTKQVIVEVPSQKVLDVVAKMCEMAGILFDKKA